MRLIPRPERVMSHGRGSWLYDEQEREYLTSFKAGLLTRWVTPRRN